jgi:tRNA G18 (ribose-2'-O)-methylase SpoU
MAPGADAARPTSIFCRCIDAACGLRFPVAPDDAFRGRCPACGAAVTIVATTVSTTIPATVSAAGSTTAARSAIAGPRLRILLDNWRSLFNVGSAFRTADGAGVEHIYLCGITATPRQPKLAKTALGAEAAVPWSYHPDAVALADELRGDGAILWALEAQPTASALFDIAADDLGAATQRPLVLAAGNEVTGVDPGLLARVERIVAVPMLGRKESLNAAIALSVAVYWLRGQPTCKAHHFQPPHPKKA